MPNQKITYNDKVGIIPKTVRENQVWDDDMNEIKITVNSNDDKALYKGTNILDETTILQLNSGVGINLTDGLSTGILLQENLLQLNGFIKVIPEGVTPVVGNVLVYSNVDGSITSQSLPTASPPPEEFELSVTSDGSIFTITSTNNITSIDLYVDRVRQIPSEFTLNSSTNEIDFGAETIYTGSILHGRIYF